MIGGLLQCDTIELCSAGVNRWRRGEWGQCSAYSRCPEASKFHFLFVFPGKGYSSRGK